MKKAIINRFLFILTFALLVSGVIAYLTASGRLLENTKDGMLKTLEVIDYALDYQGDIIKQLEQLNSQVLDTDERVTIIKADGVVVADTDYANTSALENHLKREEIKAAIEYGIGYSIRYSDTLHEKMLYTAMLSKESNYILRLSIRYTGTEDYIRALAPAYIIGAMVVLGISMSLSLGLSDAVTRPLKEITDEMSIVQGEIPNFHFKTYRYPELNRISYTTDKLTNEIKEYVEKVDFEKQVRQEFFSNASHELKTPITSIKGYAEILQNGFAKTEESKDDCIRRIIKEADHMTTLINDILMISKLETKEDHIDISKIRLIPLLEDIMESVEPLARENDIRIRVDCKPVSIFGSARQYRELLMNLITNAILYNKPSGEVFVIIRKLPEVLRVEVKDTGIGICKEDRERIFERFYRVDKGRSRKMGGTGLGLSIVKHIVAFNGGKISLESEPGMGSKFLVELPLIDKGDKAAEETALTDGQEIL
ncbi:MAG: ATP-binding protein [Lachnospiraceae bacterium]